MGDKRQVVVLGGGPCGLYAARVLSKAGVAVTVIERASLPGGLATAQRFGANWYDLGCHMLHEFDEEIYQDIMGMMGDESIPVQLNAKIRWGGKFYRYPLQFQDMIKGLPPHVLAYYGIGLLASQLRQSLWPWEPKNAEDALIQMYGKPLYRFFFEQFTHRYWGIHPTGISVTFIKDKMPRLSAVDVLKKVFAGAGAKDKGVQAVPSALSEETLHYSRTGAEAMPRNLARAITDNGGEVILNAEVARVVLDGQRVRQVVYQRDGSEHRLDCDECISTIPLPRLVQLAEPAPAAAVVEASKQLRFKPIAVFGLLVNKERCLDALYVYYRDRMFHRVGEPKNAGLTVHPSDHTVLIVETTCEVGDARWQGEDTAKQQLYTDLEAEGICSRDDIVETHVLRSDTGYPIFDLGFEPRLDTIRAWLADIDNLTSDGRQGGFKYPNMHSAMRMGAEAARTALDRLGVRDQGLTR